MFYLLRTVDVKFGDERGQIRNNLILESTPLPQGESKQKFAGVTLPITINGDEITFHFSRSTGWDYTDGAWFLPVDEVVAWEFSPGRVAGWDHVSEITQNFHSSPVPGKLFSVATGGGFYLTIWYTPEAILAVDLNSLARGIWESARPTNADLSEEETEEQPPKVPISLLDEDRYGDDNLTS